MIFPDFMNRLCKLMTHRKKWAKRQDVTCFRVYQKDIPDYPAIVDWYDGDLLVWVYDRTKDDTEAKREAFRVAIKASVSAAFELGLSRVHLKTRQRSTKGQQYSKLSRQQVTKIVCESDLKFEVNLSDYLDTGLFLDHRQTRQMCREWALGKRVLNLFAYTGSFTCYARAGGAVATTTVDLNKNYIEWAQRNMALNGFSLRSSDRFIVDNCLSFIKHDAAKNRYDLIICDPPTFSNSKRMKTSFAIDRDYPDLIKACLKLLAPGGRLVFSTNSKSFLIQPDGLPQSTQIDELTSQTVPPDFLKGCHRCWCLQ